MLVPWILRPKPLLDNKYRLFDLWSHNRPEGSIRRSRDPSQCVFLPLDPPPPLLTGRHHSPINGFLRLERSRPRDPIHRHHYHPPQFVERLRRWRPVPLLRRSNWLLQSVCAVRRRPGHGRLPAVHVVAGRWQFGWWIRRPPDTDQPVARHIRPEFVSQWRRRWTSSG